jgi:hypothetical protein
VQPAPAWAADRHGEKVRTRRSPDLYGAALDEARRLDQEVGRERAFLAGMAFIAKGIG